MRLSKFAKIGVSISIFLTVVTTGFAQLPVLVSPANFRAGERITYTIAFDNYPSAGTAEIAVSSRGRLGTRDAVELTGSFRTQGLFSAAILLADSKMTSIVAADTGVPLFVKRTDLSVGLPRERSENYIEAPPQGYDLLSMIYRLRVAEAEGVLALIDGGKAYPLSFQNLGVERVSITAGDFDTNVVALQSDYFSEQGFRDVRINFEASRNRVPLILRAKYQTGEMRISAVSIQNLEPVTVTVPVPELSPTPPVAPVPVTTPTPLPYIVNRPLPSELAFELGERLQYRISSAGVPVGRLVLNAAERKLVDSMDSLILKAEFSETNAASGLGKNNRIEAVVDPLTLLPYKVDIALTGQLSALNHAVRFDPKNGTILIEGAAPVQVPVGTHSVLSLLYAMRSFKLKPSSDLTSPVNDTRVAVFWRDRSHVFYIRPAVTEVVGVEGRPVPALLANVTTEDAMLNQLGMKVWLEANEARRLPLKFVIGPYTFDLESQTIVRPQ